MENLKVYIGYGKKKGLMSILVTDENVYEQNKLMASIGFKQIIVNEILMMQILEEYFIHKEYNLVDFVVRDALDRLHPAVFIDEIKKNRTMFYKLWSQHYEYVDKIVLEKDGDIFEISSSGRYTDNEEHTQTVHKIIERMFERKSTKKGSL